MNSKSTFALLFITFACANLAGAQEVGSLEEAQKAARKLNMALPVLAGAPISVEADLDKPCLVKGDGRGVMIVPDRKFTAAALANLGATITPVGQLWMLRVGIARDGRISPVEELRSVTVTDSDKDRDVQLYLLGARKNAQGAAELVLFAKSEKPLLVTSLAGDSAGTQSLPLEITGSRTGEDTATLVIHLIGGQRAELSLMKSE